VTAAALGTVLLADSSVRATVAWGAGIGLILQAPLGWLVLRSIGTEHFLLIWGLGMLVRITVLAVAGLVVVPALRMQAAPMLGSMVAVLVVLLGVEGVTAVREHSRGDER
jgi:hypothetical protein